MMSSDKILPTSVEHLPVEIFLQIFGFLRLHELTAAFSGLNSYIDSVIRSVTGLNHVMIYNDVDAINLLYLYSTRIIRLDMINVVTVDLTSLTNLRSLTLKYATDTQFDTVRPQHFPMLEILHIIGRIHKSANDVTKSINNLFQVILSNGFPRLRVCTAVDIPVLYSSETWSGSSALRSLHLNMSATRDYVQLLSACPNLRRFTSHSPVWPDLIKENSLLVYHDGRSKRIFNECLKLERLESENKFILDYPQVTLFSNSRLPPRFNNTKAPQLSNAKDVTVIRGRILPQSEPYCYASFLIEIRLPLKYPFDEPELIFLDPIYHPNVSQSGRHCCCWGLPRDITWKPTTPLTDVVMAAIRIIDSKPDDHFTDHQCIEEYRNDYLKFYKKALKLALSYGRPRY